MVGHVKREMRTNHSSILRPGTTGFTCGKWFIGYNFGTDDGAELKFSTHKELIVLNISINIVLMSHVVRQVTILLKTDCWPV